MSLLPQRYKTLRHVVISAGYSEKVHRVYNTSFSWIFFIRAGCTFSIFFYVFLTFYINTETDRNTTS